MKPTSIAKEQSAENWVNRFMRGRVDTQRCGDLLEAYAAGWEAHEAQCPTDAVAFAEWIAENGYTRHPQGNWRKNNENYGKWYSTAELYKLFNPSGAAVQFLCPSCGKSWDVQKHNACECGAILQKTIAPQAAGPVWVKGSERLANELSNKHYRFSDTKLPIPHRGVRSSESWGNTWLIFRCGLYDQKSYTVENVEWLDEAPPSFTPSQIEMAFYAACNGINRHLGEKAVSIETVKKLHREYMDTNFPNSKT